MNLPKVTERLQHAWNAFVNNRDPTITYGDNFSVSSSYQPSFRRAWYRGNDKFLITAIINRIAIDVAAISVQHVIVDEDGNVLEQVHDGLNECLTIEANMDQEARAFRQDVIQSLLGEGVIAVVPVDTTLDPSKSNSYDIKSMRIGRVTQWLPSTYESNCTTRRQDAIRK